MEYYKGHCVIIMCGFCLFHFFEVWCLNLVCFFLYIIAFEGGGFGVS